MERQREAQRHLEAAGEQLRGDEEGSGEAQDSSRDNFGEKKAPARGDTQIPVPGSARSSRLEDLRRRVVRGLGGVGGPGNSELREAVKRYAEGLLR
jgi:hypothetical protein